MAILQVYTVKEVAKMFHASRNTIYDELKSGYLPHFRLGNRYVIDEQDIEEWKKRKKKNATDMITIKPDVKRLVKSVPTKPPKLNVDKMFAKFKQTKKV